MTSQYQWSLRDSASAMDLCFRELRDALRTFSAIEQLLRDADDDEAMTTPLCRGDLYQLMIALNDNLQAKVHGIEKHWNECRSHLAATADQATRPNSGTLTATDIVALIDSARDGGAPSEHDLLGVLSRLRAAAQIDPGMEQVRQALDRAISFGDCPSEVRKAPAPSKLAA